MLDAFASFASALTDRPAESPPPAVPTASAPAPPALAPPIRLVLAPRPEPTVASKPTPTQAPAPKLPPGATVYQLADRTGQVWTGADPDNLRRWVEGRNRQFAPPPVSAAASPCPGGQCQVPQRRVRIGRR